ncbi:SEC-C metal-binding domain-containing protein [Sphingomonas sp. Y38-1Y]|uniref:SEC-C metal-binding domain-containing protein n=1 Tax=Sphingomonas sp. Y38-1Y TaxID=3078265 RepID=UPI0039647D8D
MLLGTGHNDRRRTWQSIATRSTSPAFERTFKRRKGYPSETQVKRGLRFVHGDKELVEKLGRNDPCPCGSGHRFQAVLPRLRMLSMVPDGTIIGVSDTHRRGWRPARRTVAAPPSLGNPIALGRRG